MIPVQIWSRSDGAIGVLNYLKKTFNPRPQMDYLYIKVQKKIKHFLIGNSRYLALILWFLV